MKNIDQVTTDKMQKILGFSFFLTCRVRKVKDARGRLQQVRAAGRQVPRDGHDGHAVTTLLGPNNAVVLRMTHSTVTKEGGQGGEETGIGRDVVKKNNIQLFLK